MAGLALEILFAPDKVVHTCDNLAENLKKFSDNIKEKVAEELESLNGFKEKLLGLIRFKIERAEVQFKVAQKNNYRSVNER